MYKDADMIMQIETKNNFLMSSKNNVIKSQDIYDFKDQNIIQINVQFSSQPRIFKQLGLKNVYIRNERI